MATRAASTIGASTSFSATCGGGKGGRGGGRVLTSRPRLTGRSETKTRRKRRSGAMGVRALRTTMSGDEDESQSPSSVAWMSKYGNRRLNYSEAGLGGTRTRSLSGTRAADRGDPAGVVDVGKQEADEDYNVGVLLLNLGGPETLDDVQPFLYNLFADPDIIRLPPVVQFLQGFLANVLSTSRAPKSREAYESIGGGSPLRRITDEQAKALQMSLESRGLEVKTYVGMRYWKPFTEDALEAIKRDAVNRLVVLPLYPQFSISTSGSSLRLLEQYFAEDQDLANVRHTVIPSWYQRPGYIKAMAQMIAQTLKKDFEDDKEPIIFFSAHGVPVSYVEDAGDPYKVEMEECVKLIVEELKSMGVTNEHILAYQSRVGPVEWLKPYTDDTIRELGKAGTKALCAVPISFVSEHIETLEEIDMEYRELAEECGIEKWGRVPALDTDPLFIDDLADAVIEALPYTTRMNKRDSSDGLSSVTDLLASYDFEKLAIPMPDSSWNKSTAKKTDQFSGSSSDLVNVSIVTLVIFVFLQYQAGANGLFGSFGVFRNW